MSSKKQDRIGIYAGTFDPVHVGHITFALQAIKVSKLDQVVFLPERMPRRKHGAEHYAHRLAMLKRAINPYPNMAVLELNDKRFTINRTWPQIEMIFKGYKLVLLVGSDVILHMQQWPSIEKLLPNCELVVGVRESVELGEIELIVKSWPQPPVNLYVVRSFRPEISSTGVRQALGKRIPARGLLTSVQRYAVANWLYVSIENALDIIKR